MKITFEHISTALSFAVMTFFIVIIVNQSVMNKTNTRIYNDFYGENAKRVLIKTNDRHFSFDPETLGDNFVMYNTLFDFAGDYSQDHVRVIYGKGEFPVPPMLDGAFFTYEQLVSEEPVAVVGKILSERTCTVDDGVEYLYWENVKYRVIGHIGTDGASDLDIIAMINWGAYYQKGKYAATYLIDSDDESNNLKVAAALCDFVEKAAEDGSDSSALNMLHKTNIRSFDWYARYLFFWSIVILALNILIVTMHYTDKRKYISAVKKLIGVSVSRLFGEQFLRLAVNATVGFLLSVAAIFCFGQIKSFAASEYGYFTVLLPSTLAFVYVVLLAVACVLTSVAVYKVYSVDTSELVRK